MDFEKKVPEWNATGTEPPASLKQSGFEAGYKPPAAYFNWFWNRVSACLSELQAKVKQVRSVADGGTGKSSFGAGNYLVGTGADELNEKTPAEVLDDIGAASKREGIPIVAATSADGVAYTATVPGLTELYNGLLLTIIPDVVSTSTAVTLNVNGLGARMVRLPLSFNNAAMSIPKMETYFTAGRPITLQFDANYIAGDGAWKTFGKQRTSAQDLYGTVPIEGGGTGAVTAAEALENLGLTATAEELNYMDGVTSNVQTQLNGKLGSSGTAAAAKKLETARAICTNLASTSNASFDGTANVAPGVSGTLPIANGGTGATTAAAARTKLGAAAASHGHSLKYDVLWTGSATNGTTVTLNKSVFSYAYVCVLVDSRESEVKPVVIGAAEPRGFTVTYLDSNKKLVTRTADITFASDGLSATMNRCAYIVHVGGGNHESAGDAVLTHILGVSLT